jgi:hypothetical protein
VKLKDWANFFSFFLKNPCPKIFHYQHMIDKSINIEQVKALNLLTFVPKRFNWSWYTQWWIRWINLIIRQCWVIGLLTVDGAVVYNTVCCLPFCSCRITEIWRIPLVMEVLLTNEWNMNCIGRRRSMPHTNKGTSRREEEHSLYPWVCRLYVEKHQI